jgi:hypothetical protein
MQKRVPLVLSATALVLAALGTTPLGAAASSVAKVVPYASVAGFAKNSAKLNGHASSASPKAGQIPVVGTNGKLSASIVGDSGGRVAGWERAVDQTTVPTGASSYKYEMSCATGKAVLGAGYSLTPAVGDLTLFDSYPTSSTNWVFRFRNATGGAKAISLYIICATAG